VDGTPPSVVREHARGKEIVFTVTDPSSGIASTGIEVAMARISRTAR